MNHKTLLLYFILVLSLNSQTVRIDFKNYYFTFPEDFIFENQIQQTLFFKTKNNELYSFIINKNNLDLTKFTEQVINKISSAKFIANEGFNLIERKRNKIYPKLKYVGCIEKKFQKCFEILNFYYNTEELLLDLVLVNPMSLAEIRNHLSQLILNNNLLENSTKENNKYLFYRIRLKIIENQYKDFFILGILTPKEKYYDYEYFIQNILSSTNIINKNTSLLNYEEYFNIQQNKINSNFLFVIDNSGSMAEEQNAVKNNVLRFFNKLSLLSNHFSVGVITTDSCNLRGSFTNSLKDFENYIQVGTNGDSTESCVYYAEKFLNDPQCNQNNIPENLSIICITDESDAYYSLANKKFDKKDNIFIKKKIPFYAIIPLDSYGNLGDCSSTNGITDYTGNFSDLSTTNQYAVDLKLLAEKTGGSISSICNEEYGTFLEELAFNSTAKNTKLKLSRFPIRNTIQVTINNAIVPQLKGNQFNPHQYYYIYSEEENSLILIGEKLSGRIKISYLTYEY
jgi:hypothetical protein